MPRNAIILGIFFQASVWSLEVGEKYNFARKDGQNLKNATLLAEDKTSYTIKLQYMQKPLVIQKKQLAHEPILVPKAIPKKSPHKFALHTTGGASVLTVGPLSNIFKTGLYFTLGMDWSMWEKPAMKIQSITVIATYSQFSNDARKIQEWGALMGPRFLIATLPSSGITFSVTPLFGASQFTLTGYTFSSAYWTPTAIIRFTTEKKMGPFEIGIQIFSASILDKSVFFLTFGANLSLMYRF